MLGWKMLFYSFNFQIPVKKIIKHEEYKKYGSFNPRRGQWAEANDIALIRLARPAETGPNIIPVCLPSIDEVIMLYGWDGKLELIYPHFLQARLAEDLQVTNMREGFKDYKGNVTLAGFGKLSDKDKFWNKVKVKENSAFLLNIITRTWSGVPVIGSSFWFSSFTQSAKHLATFSQDHEESIWSFNFFVHNRNLLTCQYS